MFKEAQEVKVSGRTRQVYVRPFAWKAKALAFLALWPLSLGLLVGCEQGRASKTPSPPPSQTAVWIELAPGIWYWEEEGRVSLNIISPLLTDESVLRFTEFTQKRIAQTSSVEQRRFWENELGFVKGQYALWSDEEKATSILENAFLSRFPLPLDEKQLQALREKLREIIQHLKVYGPDSLPENTRELPPELRSPDGGMVVSPDTLPLLIQHLSPQSLFPSCNLAASAMPTSGSPGAKAYATAACSSDAIIWGSVETQTTAWAGNDFDFCNNSGFPSSVCMSFAYGDTGCYSSARSAYYYQYGAFRFVTSSRSASNSRCR